MGNGIIVSHVGDAQYQVQVNYDTSYADQKIASIESELSRISSDTSLDDLINEKYLEYQDSLIALNAAIIALPTGYTTADEEYRAVVEATLYRDFVFTEYEEAKSKKTAQAATLVALKNQKKNIEDNRVESEVKTLWCIDKSDGGTNDSGDPNGPLLSGEVALVTAFQNPDLHLGIEAGFDAGAPYSDTYGVLVHNPAQGDFEYLYSHTMIGGVQNWRPTYYAGTVASIDEDTNVATVITDARALVEQETLVNVPVNYMDCDAAAFNVGDHVIIKFDSYLKANASVVGFFSRPRDCYREKVLFNDFSFTSGAHTKYIGGGGNTGMPLTDDEGQYRLTTQCIKLCGGSAGFEFHNFGRLEVISSGTRFNKWNYSNPHEIDIGGDRTLSAYYTLDVNDQAHEYKTYYSPAVTCGGAGEAPGDFTTDGSKTELVTEGRRYWHIRIIVHIAGFSYVAYEEETEYLLDSNVSQYVLRTKSEKTYRILEWCCTSGEAYSIIEHTQKFKDNVYFDGASNNDHIRYITNRIVKDSSDPEGSAAVDDWIDTTFTSTPQALAGFMEVTQDCPAGYRGQYEDIQTEADDGVTLMSGDVIKHEYIGRDGGCPRP